MRVWRVMGILGVTAGLLFSGLTSAAAAAPSEEGARCAADPTTPPGQFRATWVSSVVNIDWPSKPGLSAAQQQAELIAMARQRGHGSTTTPSSSRSVRPPTPSVRPPSSPGRST